LIFLSPSLYFSKVHIPKVPIPKVHIPRVFIPRVLIPRVLIPKGLVPLTFPLKLTLRLLLRGLAFFIIDFRDLFWDLDS
jgi:hypothetical protein